MSVTQCRTCDQPITFVLRDDGRWRPVEVRYQELTADGDEMIAVQKGGSWTQLSNKVRVFTTHSCLDDPSWNRGRPTMTARVLVDVETGEIVEEPEDEDEEPDWHAQRQEQRREYCLRTFTPKRAVAVACECGVPAGEPCAPLGVVTNRACQIRKLSIAFSEEIGEPWPPRQNQTGYRQMQDWLREHHTLFAKEEA